MDLVNHNLAKTVMARKVEPTAIRKNPEEKILIQESRPLEIIPGMDLLLLQMLEVIIPELAGKTAKAEVKRKAARMVEEAGTITPTEVEVGVEVAVKAADVIGNLIEITLIIFFNGWVLRL